MAQNKGFAVFLRVFVCRHVTGSKKVCTEGLQRPCKNTKPPVGSDPQIFWHFSAKYLKDHSHQARTEKNMTVISSNPQIHAAFWHELFEGLQRPRKNAKPLVGSDPQIFWQFSAKYLKDHSHQARTEKNTTVISSNPQIHAAFWHELFEGLHNRARTTHKNAGRQ